MIIIIIITIMTMIIMMTTMIIIIIIITLQSFDWLAACHLGLLQAILFIAV
jgi:hypothetical protein